MTVFDCDVGLEVLSEEEESEDAKVVDDIMYELRNLRKLKQSSLYWDDADVGHADDDADEMTVPSPDSSGSTDPRRSPALVQAHVIRRANSF